jgi:hypothetical protein
LVSSSILSNSQIRQIVTKSSHLIARTDFGLN